MRETLAKLAVPRLHGTPAADRVALEIRRLFEKAGCTVTERPFTFSELPGRFGVPLAGLLLMAVLPAAAYLVASGSTRGGAFLLLLLAALFLVTLRFMDALVLDLPWRRRAGVNLLASPPAAQPRFLVVAHRDSKSQPVPLAARVGGVFLVLGAWVGLAALTLSGSVSVVAATAAGTAGALGGAIIACCAVGNHSAGALDNASGVAALLRLAELENGSPDVAFLVTDAEELGLAGARAEIGSFPAIEAVVNLDGLDDAGRFHVIEGRAVRWRSPSPLAKAIEESAAEQGLELRRRGLPPGLLLDHLPFERSGQRALTVMRGTVASLARVHRPADELDRIAGTGAAITARLVSSALTRLRNPARQGDAGAAVGSDRRVASGPGTG